jgi:hypothetical protein
MFKNRVLPLAGVALLLALGACGGGGEPSQQDLQAALGASKELPDDPSIQVEKLRCEASLADKQTFICKYRFPPADPIEGLFKKEAGAWRHVGPAPSSDSQH